MLIISYYALASVMKIIYEVKKFNIQDISQLMYMDKMSFLVKFNHATW